MDQHHLQQSMQAVKAAAPLLAQRSDDEINGLLLDLADRVVDSEEEILAANSNDLSRMDQANPKYDRLLLNHERLTAIANDLRLVASLPSPVGEVLEQRSLENGLQLSKIRVPVGVIAVIFESRPNVTFDVAALCLKSQNACVLKGSSDAAESNTVIVNLIHQALDTPALKPQRFIWPHLSVNGLRRSCRQWTV